MQYLRHYMKFIICLAFGFLFPIINTAWSMEGSKLPLPEVETLPNGLQVVWFTNDKLPLVDIVLLVKSGYRDDLPGKSGTTELLAATLDRGAAGMNAQSIAHSIEMLGASRAVASDEDSVGVTVHGLAPDATPLLDVLSKIVLQADFPEQEIKRESERIFDRWNHIPDYGESIVSLMFQRTLTAGTSYFRGGFRSAEEFKGISRGDVISYYKKHFIPKNAVLMMVGRVNRVDFKEKILATFGKWSSSGDPLVHAYKVDSDPHYALPGKEEILLVNRPNLTQAQVRIGFRAPLLSSPDHYALTVGNAILGEYFNSRLNILIRDQLGLTYAINSSFIYNKEFASFVISTATRNESVGHLIKKTLDVLELFNDGYISSDEIKTGKEYLEGSFSLSTSTLSAVAARWLSGQLMGMGSGYLNEFIPKIDAVTQTEVNAAVKKHLQLDHVVIAVAGDAKEIEKELKKVKLGKIRKISANDLTR